MELNNEIFKRLSQYKIDGAQGFLSNYEGERKSRQKGQSQEFSDYRPYYAGDDIRLIDWNAYGRTDQYHIKLYEEERETRITILLDHSASMGISENKRGFTKTMVILLAYVGLSAGDSIRIVTQSESGKFIGTEYFKGVDKQHVIRQKLDDLKWEGAFSVDGVVKDITFAKGVTVVISDFLYEGYALLHGHLKFANQHIIGVQLLTQETLEPSFLGPHEFENVENGELLELDLTVSVLKAYHEKLNQHLEGVETLLTSNGDRYVFLDADDDKG